MCSAVQTFYSVAARLAKCSVRSRWETTLEGQRGRAGPGGAARGRAGNNCGKCALRASAPRLPGPASCVLSLPRLAAGGSRVSQDGTSVIFFTPSLVVGYLMWSYTGLPGQRLFIDSTSTHVHIDIFR